MISWFMYVYHVTVHLCVMKFVVATEPVTNAGTQAYGYDTEVFFVVDMAVRMIEAKPKRFFKGDESKAP